MREKRISPAAAHALKEALAVVFWYKKELRAFLSTALDDSLLIARFDWTLHKRAITTQLVDYLVSGQPTSIRQITDLMMATVEIGDPVHLKSLDDGGRQYGQAVSALKALDTHIAQFREAIAEREEEDKKRAAAEAAAAIRRVTSEKLTELKSSYFQLLALTPQERGYKLETLLTDLFALYDIEAKGPFRVKGEQIDGAFTFEGTEFILEAKWEKELTPLAQLDTFSGKVGRKLENTLGLFVSINGYQPTAIESCSGRRSVIILMDGADLMAVLEDRISLSHLLARKKQHAARTGEVMLPAALAIG